VRYLLTNVLRIIKSLKGGAGGKLAKFPAQPSETREKGVADKHRRFAKGIPLVNIAEGSPVLTAHAAVVIFCVVCCSHKARDTYRL
jgi:hypothetical protein